MEYYSPLEAVLKPTEAADAKQLFRCLNGQFLELYKWDFLCCFIYGHQFGLYTLNRLPIPIVTASAPLSSTSDLS